MLSRHDLITTFRLVEESNRKPYNKVTTDVYMMMIRDVYKLIRDVYMLIKDIYMLIRDVYKIVRGCLLADMKIAKLT